MKEALKLALEALESINQMVDYEGNGFSLEGEITAIKAALAQPTSGDYALGYAEGFNDACKPKPAQQEPTGMLHIDRLGKWLDASLKERKSQPAQQEPVAWSSYEYDGIHHKPVAWMDSDGNVSDNNDHKCFPIPLYTITHPNPPQRTWVGLTDEEFQYCVELKNSEAIAEEVEAKLKELNT